MFVDLIVGARPNFVKIAALYHANRKRRGKLQFRLIHTGQHYDDSLSGSFFRQLQLPVPDFNLNIGSGTQAEQTASIMLGYEKILQTAKPDICLVVGDVNSSMACAITAKKMKIKVAHVEAGIRSNDWDMPEEVNRVLIDSITDYYFTTTETASKKLISFGAPPEKVYFVGNTMIDTLINFRHYFQKPQIWEDLELNNGSYFILTLHRPSNLEKLSNLKRVLQEILNNTRELPIIFPLHPRTRNLIGETKFKGNLHLIEPLSYFEFNYLVERAKGVITDSGGITEETTFFGVPCLTLRNSTERPETVIEGTNELIGLDHKAISPAINKIFNGVWKTGRVPSRWDGKSAERIIEVLGNLKI